LNKSHEDNIYCRDFFSASEGQEEEGLETAAGTTRTKNGHPGVNIIKLFSFVTDDEAQ
jgi:hypothetical protein